MWNEASFLTHCPQPLICFVSISARDYPAVPSTSNAGHPGAILDCFRPPPPLTDRCLWQFYRPYPASLAAPLMENPPACWRPGSIPGLGRYPGEGKGYPLQCSGLENSVDWVVHGAAKSWTQLSAFHFHFTLSNIPGVQLESFSHWSPRLNSVPLLLPAIHPVREGVPSTQASSLWPVRDWAAQQEVSGGRGSQASSVFTAAPAACITSWTPPPVRSAAG